MLKGLSILFVVIGHLRPNDHIERYLYSVHVFLFFAISGFLFSPNTIFNKEYICKKSRRLLIPYAFWSVLATIAAIILGTHWNEALRTMLTLGGSIGINRPIWFLPVLFITEILYAMLTRKKERNPYQSIYPRFVRTGGFCIWRTDCHGRKRPRNDVVVPAIC